MINLQRTYYPFRGADHVGFLAVPPSVGTGNEPNCRPIRIPTVVYREEEDVMRQMTICRRGSGRAAQGTINPPEVEVTSHSSLVWFGPKEALSAAPQFLVF